MTMKVYTGDRVSWTLSDGEQLRGTVVEIRPHRILVQPDNVPFIFGKSADELRPDNG